MAKIIRTIISLHFDTIHKYKKWLTLKIVLRFIYFITNFSLCDVRYPNVTWLNYLLSLMKWTLEEQRISVEANSTVWSILVLFVFNSTEVLSPTFNLWVSLSLISLFRCRSSLSILAKCPNDDIIFLMVTKEKSR